MSRGQIIVIRPSCDDYDRETLVVVACRILWILLFEFYLFKQRGPSFPKSEGRFDPDLMPQALREGKEVGGIKKRAPLTTSFLLRGSNSRAGAPTSTYSEKNTAQVIRVVTALLAGASALCTASPADSSHMTISLSQGSHMRAAPSGVTHGDAELPKGAHATAQTSGGGQVTAHAASGSHVPTTATDSGYLTARSAVGTPADIVSAADNRPSKGANKSGTFANRSNEIATKSGRAAGVSYTGLAAAAMREEDIAVEDPANGAAVRVPDICDMWRTAWTSVSAPVSTAPCSLVTCSTAVRALDYTSAGVVLLFHLCKYRTRAYVRCRGGSYCSLLSCGTALRSV